MASYNYNETGLLLKLKVTRKTLENTLIGMGYEIVVPSGGRFDFMKHAASNLFVRNPKAFKPQKLIHPAVLFGRSQYHVPRRIDQKR